MIEEMKYDPRDYEVKVRWSSAEGDQCYIAQVSEWPAVSAHGETREEAVKEVQVALELALSWPEVDGFVIPPPALVSA